MLQKSILYVKLWSENKYRFITVTLLLYSDWLLTCVVFLTLEFH